LGNRKFQHALSNCLNRKHLIIVMFLFVSDAVLGTGGRIFRINSLGAYFGDL